MNIEKLSQLLHSKGPVESLTNEQVDQLFEQVIASEAKTIPFFTSFFDDTPIIDNLDTLEMDLLPMTHNSTVFGNLFKDYVLSDNFGRVSEYEYFKGVCDVVAAEVFYFFQEKTKESALAESMYKFMQDFSDFCLGPKNDNAPYSYKVEIQDTVNVTVRKNGEDNTTEIEQIIFADLGLKDIVLNWIMLFDPVVYVKTGYEIKLKNKDGPYDLYHHIIKDYQNAAFVLNNSVFIPSDDFIF